MIKPEPTGLITHNMIDVCIGTSPYLVIVDLVIIGSIGSSHHHVLLFPLCDVVAAIAAPARATGVVPLPAGRGRALHLWPHRGQPTLVVWPPFAGATLQLAAPASAALQSVGPASACRPYRLAVADRPQSAAPLQVAKLWPATLAGGLVMAGHPSSSLRLLRKHNKNA
ncbi:hypothetical protein GW17_00051831 [Ensete ventricosum]|nr:hypothetical protein GW17_00051831 [Ensete ventricosum]